MKKAPLYAAIFSLLPITAPALDLDTIPNGCAWPCGKEILTYDWEGKLEAAQGSNLTVTTSFSGDVSGVYTNLQLGTGVVTSTEILDYTIATADIATGAVTSASILDGTVDTGDLGANVNAKFVEVAGDTMTGDLVVDASFIQFNGAGTRGVKDADGNIFLELIEDITHTSGIVRLGDASEASSGFVVEIDTDGGVGGFGDYNGLNNQTHIKVDDPNQKITISGGNVDLSGNTISNGSFVGNGAGLTNLPAGTATNAWSLAGNTGTVAGTDFIGTADDTDLHIKVNNSRIMLLDPNATSPNIIAGRSGNASLNGSAFGSVISGGGSASFPNTYSGNYAAIGGGEGNSATSHAAIAGGRLNAASGQYSAVPGGLSNIAQGDYSLAAGRQAFAANDGSFVFADSTAASFQSQADDTFIVRAANGVGINTNNPSDALHVVGNISVSGDIIFDGITLGRRNTTQLVAIYSGTTNVIDADLTTP